MRSIRRMFRSSAIAQSIAKSLRGLIWGIPILLTAGAVSAPLESTRAPGALQLLYPVSLDHLQPGIVVQLAGLILLVSRWRV